MFRAAVAIKNDEMGPALQVEYCRTLHERLTARAKQRVGLEAEEARDLVFAEEAGLHRFYGYVSMLEYMERELHYGPHAAKERLRVANELFLLPKLAAKFRAGELPFSVLREVTRVAVPENEEDWLATTEGKTAREVERLVSGLAKGDAPDAPRNPKLERHRVVLDLDGERFAKWRAMQIAADDEQGKHLDDNELVDAIARKPSSDGTSPPCTHAVTTCRVCKQSSFVAAGMEVPLTDNARDRLLCDSVEVGDLESDEVTRAKSNIPSSTRRRAFIRDRFACVVPGCRSRRNLDLHHVIFQSHGGTHAMSNIAALCSGHHDHVHEGRLSIKGVAPDRLVFSFRQPGDDEPHLVLTSAPVTFDPIEESDDEETSVPRGTERSSGQSGAGIGATRALAARPSKLGVVTLRTQARDALVGLGWKIAIASAAVEQACAHVGMNTSIDVLIREALRRCPRPTS